MNASLSGGPCDKEKVKIEGTPPLFIDRAIHKKNTPHESRELPKLARYKLNLRVRGAEYVFEGML